MLLHITLSGNMDIRAKGHSVDKMKLGLVAIVVQVISELEPIIVITCP